MKSLVSFLVAFCCLLLCIWTGSGCANIIPPEGGPKDTLPPVLLSATPRDSTLNFTARRIVLQFDEYVDLKDVQNNLLFTPTFETNPVIEAKLHTLTIRLKDSLEPNTTYRFDFGNAIQDINENNILRNFVYTFSTGSYIDSLTLSGHVELAETGKIDTTLTILLHNHLDDSAVVKERPRYVTRVNNNGDFTFRNLPADTFAIYVLGDAGIMRRYTSKSQLFAFSDRHLITPDTSPLTLYAYRETPELNPGSSGTGAAAAPKGEKRLTFSTNLSNEQQDLLKDLVFTFDRPLRSFDSSKIRLTSDSTFTPVTGYAFSLDTTKKILSLRTTWEPGLSYNLLLEKDFATDTLNRQLLKADTLSFSTREQSEYGSLNIRLRRLDTTLNPVLQLVQNDNVVFSASIKSGLVSQPLFVPGDYELRILYDQNNNGKWDPGQFFAAKKQPERVRNIDRKITVKAGQPADFDIPL